jgi:hypothetical protein
MAKSDYLSLALRSVAAFLAAMRTLAQVGSPNQWASEAVGP